jgi:hypothetical protein
MILFYVNYLLFNYLEKIEKHLIKNYGPKYEGSANTNP